MRFFSCSVLNVYPLKCVSMNNQVCRIRSQIINVNINEPSFYPYSILANKCSGSCNNINYPYIKLRVSADIKKINARVFSLMERANGTRHII